MSFPAELGTAEWTMIWGAGIALVSILVLWRLSRYDLVGAMKAARILQQQQVGFDRRDIVFDDRELRRHSARVL